MVLYAADLSKLDAPTKKVSKKKQPEVEPKVEPEPVEAPVKPKRVLSEKQKEALLKGQETRRLKKEALQKEKEENEALEKRLLEAQKKPRKRKVLEIEAPVEEIEVPTEEVPTEEVKVEKKKRTPKPKQEPAAEPESEPKPKRSKKENEPPVWFKKYVEDVQKEKASIGGEVSKKQENIIKTEALKVAKKSWQSGFTRDRVQGEVDNHMNRMYRFLKN